MDRQRICQPDLRIPVLLVDDLGSKAPLLQIGTHTQGADHLTDLGQKSLHRRVIQVIPVVVADCQHIDVREIIGRIHVGTGKSLVHEPEG